MHGRALELVTRLRALEQKRPDDRARIEETVTAVIEAAISSLQKAIGEPYSADLGELVPELASIFVALNRVADAQQLVDQVSGDADRQTVPDKPDLLGVSASSMAEEHHQRASASVKAARLYSIIGSSTLARQRLQNAVALIENIQNDGKWSDDTYETGCAVFIAASSVDSRLARRASNLAIGQAAREPDFSRRTIMFANLAYRAAMADDYRLAVSLVGRSGNPLLTLAIFSLVLDRIVAKDNPDIYRRWNLANKSRHPISSDFLKVDSVPACG